MLKQISNYSQNPFENRLNTISLINFIKYLPGYVPPYLFLLLMILLLSHRSVLSAGLVVVQFEVFVHFHCHLIILLLDFFIQTLIPILLLLMTWFAITSTELWTLLILIKHHLLSQSRMFAYLLLGPEAADFLGFDIVINSLLVLLYLKLIFHHGPRIIHLLSH